MDRYEVEDDGRLTALIEAARRGDEAVLTQGGQPVAKVTPTDNLPVKLRTRDGREPRSGINWEALKKLHDALPPGMRGGGADTIRELRDMGY